MAKKEVIFTGKLYALYEIADHYGVKLSTVQGWIRAKKMRALKVGGSKMYRVREEDLAAFEISCQTIPAQTGTQPITTTS